MLLPSRLLAIILILLITLFFLLRPSKPRHTSPHPYLKLYKNIHPDIFNSTLGFQRILTLSLPARTDRRDALTLAAALTNLTLTILPGISGSDVPSKVLPPDSLSANISPGNKGSWRAHMNALQQVVQENLRSVLILEDDADWDVRIRGQLGVFARAALAYTQPIGPDRLTLSSVSSSPSTDLDRPISSLPSSLHPTSTPYGSDWDVLWLGHCGTDFPRFPRNKTSPTPLRVIIPDDQTVPSPKNLKPHPFALQDGLATEYPPHTRVVHASSGTVCTQAYAVSQQGARKLLWKFGLKTLTNGWDFMLRDWCDGGYEEEEEEEEEEEKNRDEEGREKSGRGRGPVCVTVQPPLFSHYYGKGGGSDIAAPGGGFISKEREMSPYLRLSVRLNMGRLVRGVGVDELVDQFGEG